MAYYAALGAREVWRVERKGGGVAVDILDLHAGGGPSPSETGPSLFLGLEGTQVGRLLTLAHRNCRREMETLFDKLLSPPDPEAKKHSFHFGS